MQYGKDPNAQMAEDAYLASEGVQINSPIGILAYKEPSTTTSTVEVHAPPFQPGTPPRIAVSDKLQQWHARREQNKSVVGGSSFGGMSTIVSSWLTEEGKCSVDENDDLASTGRIQKGEHLRRLHLAYARRWKGRLSISVSGLVARDKHFYLSDVHERLALLEDGVYIAPTSWSGRTLNLSRFQTRKRLLRKPIRVRAPEWHVGLAEYDRRLRIFVYGICSSGRHNYVKYGDQYLTSISGSDLTFIFMASPRSTDF